MTFRDFCAFGAYVIECPQRVDQLVLVYRECRDGEGGGFIFACPIEARGLVRVEGVSFEGIGVFDVSGEAFGSVVESGGVVVMV